MPSSAFILRAGLALVSFTSTIFQASAQTVTPVGTWSPGPTCSAGGDPSANNGLGGGGYTDKYGGIWDAHCANTLPNAVPVGISPSGTTNGQGWYGCAKGCAKRPGCTAFLFTPTTPALLFPEIRGPTRSAQEPAIIIPQLARILLEMQRLCMVLLIWSEQILNYP